MLADLYHRLIATLRHHADLAAALRLLEWDQETYMPAGVAGARARQIGTLAAALHEQETAEPFIGLVDELAAQRSELTPEQAVDVRETQWRINRVRALPTALVRERSELHAEARAIWIRAREADDFATLAPYLERIVILERQFAAAIDPGRDPYDILLEEYEPGTSSQAVATSFAPLRDGLVELLGRLRSRPERSPTDALHGDFPIDAQRRFNRLVAERLGFDFERGRLDEAVHPFTTSIGNDVRLTTRYDPSDLRYGLYSTIHETGHGLYEQGLDPQAWGTPRGTACSLGVHESQSRLWENHVGRSAAFWESLLPVASEVFPSLRSVSVAAIVSAVNRAGASLIRTEADEITYNLHIILRFELERMLIDGTLAVADLPLAWRERMLAYLGIAPSSDRDGVLQDVHWASGAIGYFPTYTLGNIYGAQLMEAVERHLGGAEVLADPQGPAMLLGWLRRQVHRWGQTYRAPELIAHATGYAPSSSALLRHLERKLALLEPE
jgi:carboxypeptidase Taq